MRRLALLLLCLTLIPNAHAQSKRKKRKPPMRPEVQRMLDELARKSREPQKPEPPPAPEWKFAGKFRTGSYYYDPRSIERMSSGIVRVWVLNLPSGWWRTTQIEMPKTFGLDEDYTTYSFSLQMWEYDCEARQSRMSTTYDFDYQGNKLHASAVTIKWLDINPSDVIFQDVCQEGNKQ
jgi:hypothetical protein